jgi:hypothetical protein
VYGRGKRVLLREYLERGLSKRAIAVNPNPFPALVQVLVSPYAGGRTQTRRVGRQRRGPETRRKIEIERHIDRVEHLVLDRDLNAEEYLEATIRHLMDPQLCEARRAIDNGADARI